MIESTLVERALHLAQQAHKGQFRKYTGEPYLIHPLRIAAVMGAWGETVVAAALLHDVKEDCPHISDGQIIDVVGSDVFQMVCDLTNSSKGSSLLRADRKRMDREHYRLRSFDVCAIKTHDRMDNLRDMSEAPEDFRRLYAKESRELFYVLRQRITSSLSDKFDAVIKSMGA